MKVLQKRTVVKTGHTQFGGLKSRTLCERVGTPAPAARQHGSTTRLANARSIQVASSTVMHSDETKHGAASAEALIIDGTNLQILARADAGCDVTHADAFTAWLSALRHLTSCSQMYVIFDNKRGSGLLNDVLEVRRDVVPEYLSKRRAKALGSNTQRHRQAGNPRALRSACLGLRGTGDAKGPQVNEDDESARTRPRPHGAGAGPDPRLAPDPDSDPDRAADRGSGADSAVDWERLMRLSERLMDQTPSHLVRCVEAVQRLGGLVLYGMLGYEADDLIASLLAGLLPATDQPQQPNAAGSARDPDPSPFHASRLVTMRSPGSAIPSSHSHTHPPTRTHTHSLAQSAVVASSDSDMLQLLATPGCAWLELRQLSRATSPQEPPPLLIHSEALPGIPAALLRLHRAAAAAPPPPLQPSLLDLRGAAARATTVRTVATAAVSYPAAAVKAHSSAAGDAIPQAVDGPAMGVAVRKQQVSASPAALPAAAYPDYLALVGKQEAGVAGVGVSARSARRLLSTYGSIQEIVQAYNAGALDGSLQPLAAGGRAAALGTGARGTDEEDLAVAGTRTGIGARAGTGAVAGDVASGKSRGPWSSGAPAYPPALQRALRNLQVTRMRAEPASVPWHRVGAYQQQLLLRGHHHHRQQQPDEVQQSIPQSRQLLQRHHEHQQQQQQQQQRLQHHQQISKCLPASQQWLRQGAGGQRQGWQQGYELTFERQAVQQHQHQHQHQEHQRQGVWLLDTFCTSHGLNGFGAGLSPLHSHDQLHLRSAAPFVAALAEALSRRGATCRTACVDEQGYLYDIILEVLDEQSQGRLIPASEIAREAPVEVMAEALVATAGATAVGAPEGPAVRRLEGPVAMGGCASEAPAGTARGAAGAPAAPISVKRLPVCVLAPWDFVQRPGLRLQQQRQQRQGQDKEQSQRRAGAKVGGAAPAASLPLLAFAEGLRTAAGHRRSLQHTPPGLEAALRSTTAWRLKRAQRNLSVLAVIPFYELLQ